MPAPRSATQTELDLSPSLISEVTDSIQEEVKLWQDRPLEALYPIMYLWAGTNEVMGETQTGSQWV